SVLHCNAKMYNSLTLCIEVIQIYLITVFFDSDHGGEHCALLYGLIGTCRPNGIDPEAYLRHILNILPEWPSDRVDKLLSWNVALTNK
ncbi:transposase domain-containing protein, partial [Escherichia coli]